MTAVWRSFLIFVTISSVDLPSAKPRYEKNMSPNMGFQIVCRAQVVIHDGKRVDGRYGRT